MNASKFGALALSVVLGGVIIGCGSSGGESNSTSSTSSTPGGAPAANDPNAIKIGLVASVSGDQKPWGDDQYEGAQLAVKEFNDAGGVDGKKVALVLGDSGSKADQAKTAAEKVLAESVIGIVGEVSSGNTIQIAKSAKDKNVPVVAVGATRTDLTEVGNVWRVCYTDDFQGPVMATFAFDKLKLRKIAVMTDMNLPYSQGLSKSFIEKFKTLGGEIVKEASYESGGKQTPDYASLLTEIKAANPDGMFLSGYFPEVGPIAKQAKASGLDNVKFLGGDGWDSDQLLVGGGDAIIGGFFCNHYNSFDTRPQVKTFLDKWKSAHGGKDPSTTMAALGYDATALILDALKRAKTKDAAGLSAAIEDTENFAAVSGDIKLKGMKGNPPKRAIVVEVSQKDANGNWQKFAIDYTPDKIK
jgi:branched-chain amino acid transport system substrate-binding protein